MTSATATSDVVRVTFVDRAAGVETVVEIGPDETVLDAALRAGVDIPYSCRSGTCRTCYSRVEQGVVDLDPEYRDELLIDDQEEAAGYRLLCSSFARTDSVIDIG